MQQNHVAKLEAAPTGVNLALLGGGSVVHTTERGQQMLVQRLQEKQGQPGYTGLQNFEEIKADCLTRKVLFEDSEFPATQVSIFGDEEQTKELKWLRPHEIVKDPEFIVGGADRTDIQQGEVGDCWLLAAVASMTCFPQLLEKVVPMDQNFKTDYAGIFHFRFWHFGHWLDVVIDDRLPTFKGQLVYLHSKSANEFWSALLEKAYAKLYGSYAALKGGSIGEALEDFTGGLCERFDLETLSGDTKKLFEIFERSFRKCSMLGCAISAEGQEIEDKLENGLIVGHAYSITAIRDLEIKNHGHVKLVRVRNPWGDSEWNGPWSDESDEWKQVSEEEKKKLCLQVDNDGEFWMNVDDFINEFTTVEICHLGPDAIEEDLLDGKTRHHWEMRTEYGSWRRNVNAGGCRNYVDTFWTNPQFLIEVTAIDDHKHAGQDPESGTVLIGLMQKEARGTDHSDNLSIGYMLYEYDEKSKDLQNGLLTKRYVQTHKSVAKAEYADSREIVERFALKRGKYMVIVSTFEPNEENDFMIRICSEKQQVLKENDSKTSMSQDQDHDPLKVVKLSTVELENVKTMFKEFASKDGEMNAYQLHDLFAKHKEFFVEIKNYNGFHPETCRSMVALMDADCSGKLSLPEFLDMWKNLMFWKKNFVQYDADNSGEFDAFELRNALNGIGYVVSNKVFNTIVMRYVNQSNTVSFEDYMICVIRLKTVFENFKAHPKTNENKAQFDLDEFVQMMVYV